MAERLKVMERCQKIAARIMAGDKVPPQICSIWLKTTRWGIKWQWPTDVVEGKAKEWESVLEDDEKEAGASRERRVQRRGRERGGTEASGGAAESAAE